MSTFGAQWYDNVVLPMQYGRGTNGLANPVTGQLASGDVTLDEATLAANRIDYGQLIATHVLDDDTTRERGAQLEKVAVPLLSAANWGGQGLHLRGNIEGFLRAFSKHKWLEVHGREHWAEFFMTRLQTGCSWTGCSTSVKRRSRAQSRSARQVSRIASTRTKASGGSSPDFANCASSPEQIPSYLAT